MAFFFKKNESKGIFFSLLIHTTLLGAFLADKDDPVKIADKEKMVAVDLTCTHLLKEVPSKTKPEPVVKKEEKPKKQEKPKEILKPETKEKTVKKEIKKHKPIIEKKTEKKILKKEQPKTVQKKEKIIKKEIKKEIEEKKNDDIKKKPEKEVNKNIKNTIQDKKVQKQSFIKTNFAVIRDMVLSNLKYPSIAKRMGWSGSVKLKLVVDTSGKIIHYSIAGSSNKKQLDNAALEAVKTILRETLPKPKTKTTIILPVLFKLH